ncbi:MAG TPA: MFS transporter [Caulobacteraceae bacterium]|jgi:MFS family permease|nr:MFS transporter [Caulobacteraceae bacterium]
MAFFRNDAINRVNLHSGVQAAASGAGGVFLLAFLLGAGVPVAGTLAAFAGILAGRFVLRPIILPLGRRFGLKPLLIAGTVLEGVQYPILAQVHGLDLPLIALVVVSSAGSACYWPAYHAYFASLGDAEHRGHQVSAREAIVAVVGIAAPLAGGWALVNAGPVWTFDAIALIQAASALPLLGAPNVAVAARAPGALAAARHGALIFAADGWFGGAFYYVWQVLLFVSLGRDLEAFGGAMALAALVGAAIGLFFGRHIDKGHGRRAAVIAYAAAALVVVLRAVAVGSPWLAVAANAIGSLAVALLVPAMMTAVYNLAKASPDPFRFHAATEGAWDIGCAGAVLAGAALAALGAPMGIAIALALPAAGGCAWLLWRYYGANPGAGGVEVDPLRPGEPL